MRFRDHVHAGDILALAARYRDAGADELVFYDIGASPGGGTVDRAWVRRVARLIDIPFCVAGGIRSEADAERVLSAGAEKVSVNTPALEDPTLIDRLSRRFGAQCVVVGIDSRRTPQGLRAWMRTGDSRRACDSGREVVSWVREVQERGAGEVVLNCMDADGVRAGYDLGQLREVRAHCAVPLIASGGAGCEEDFAQAFAHGADGALAAGVFHSGALGIGELKGYLRGRGIEVRP